MRYLILLFCLVFSAVADNYNTEIIGIHAKVFPKILLIDTKIDEKLVNGAIKVIILYTEEDIKIANSLKEEMLSFYPSLKEHPFQITVKEYKEFDATEAVTAYYQLLGDKESVLSVNKSAQENSLITFSYDKNYLDYGTLMSLYISNKVSPYISLESLKQSNIILDNVIYKIAKIK